MAYAIFADRRKFETEARGFRHKKIVRHLNENARAVAGVRFAADRAAMIQVDENLQGVAHQLVRLLALHVDDEAQPARIVLELRIVESLFRWCAQTHITSLISFRHFIQVNAE